LAGWLHECSCGGEKKEETVVAVAGGPDVIAQGRIGIKNVMEEAQGDIRATENTRLDGGIGVCLGHGLKAGA
jgi:hypothetical protein